ncbi:GNAT family N-acetyltransferase [Geomicrobium sp. JCM 19055]|uniref:GNAT family N-acetyltransferase n=1 Tax=Geomicrobium sp. JCM 19055 TaxID=1460649 RepID=UPI00045ED89A|nr:GNAT family N-acetyltransferase [Geomicrobium sp. JCM 19055]GAJ98912.1 acetyltransferase, GNAT family [Geomicrobium sp. JCM 19055]
MISKEEKQHVYQDQHGEEMGKITFKPIGSKKIIIDHTIVKEAHRGKGIAEELVHSVVERMRSEEKVILPLCPFAKAEFERNPSYQDIQVEK